LSSGSGASVIFLLTGSPDRVGTLSRPGTRPGIRPVIQNDRLEEAAIASRFPVAFPLPAFASRSSCSRRGVGPSLRSAYRDTPKGARTSTGLPRSARMSCDRDGCPLYPEDGGAPPGQVVSLTGACRSTAASPYTPLQHPITRGFASRGINGGSSNSPVRSSPRLWPPGWNGPPLGFPPSFAPRRPGADDARRGRDRPSSTGLDYALNITSVDPPIV
jgi:hypothetical protein